MMWRLTCRSTYVVQVSVGTLLAFTMVAICVLILRYVPPDEVPLPSSLQESIDSVSLWHGRNSHEISEEDPNAHVGSSKESTKPLLDKVDILVELPLFEKQLPFVDCKFLMDIVSYLTLLFSTTAIVGRSNTHAHVDREKFGSQGDIRNENVLCRLNTHTHTQIYIYRKVFYGMLNHKCR